jgi:hypothetical protein
VKFFNTSISGRREEGATPVLEGEKSTRVALGIRAEGRSEDAATRWRPTAEVGQCQD